MTLGGPILRDRVWFFGSYRRVQQDQTFNNAPVPLQRRGNLFRQGHDAAEQQPAAAGELPVGPDDQENAVIRGSVAPGRNVGCSTGIDDDRVVEQRDAMQIVARRRSGRSSPAVRWPA